MNYDQRLDRALDRLPDLSGEEGRLSVPDPEPEADGAFTRLNNLGDIADVLSRDAEHLHRSIQRELGTNGQFDGERSRYNGSFSVSDFSAAIDEYVAEFVTCSECGLPDTRLVTENGTRMLRCEACGAFRPVAKRTSKAADQGSSALIEEGETYEVKITDTGRKGDGVAEKGKFTIFVSGAREGQVVDAYIESINGTLAFARVV